MTDGYDVVVMNADGTPEIDASVNLGVELDGAFVAGLTVLGGGLMLVIAGLLLLLLRRRRPTAPTRAGSYPASDPNGPAAEGDEPASGNAGQRPGGHRAVQRSQQPREPGA
jgi:hypothetical protein